jgi:hypothetical protein
MKIIKILYVFLIAMLLLPYENFSQSRQMKLYGHRIIMKKVTPFHEAYESPGKFKNKEVVLAGTVTTVCKTKGCWMEITDGKDKIRVKFENYSFFVPWDSKGKKVKIQGKILKEKVKADTFKHWLEESGEPKEKIDKIKSDQKVVTFIATGVMMEGGSEISPEQRAAIAGEEKK